IIFDVVPGQVSFARCKESLKEGGLYLAVAGGIRELLQSAGLGVRGSKKVMAGSPPETAEDMAYLVGLLAEGKIKPLIDRCYPLEEIVAAHAHVDSGRKRGSVIINIASA
ncbi:MAG: zinc-binding dehydrogenase, partial [Anaerolineae bacterium]|nr:zinc-binding dehydrogenase [Anaerolineae bacterium]